MCVFVCVYVHILYFCICSNYCPSVYAHVYCNAPTPTQTFLFIPFIPFPFDAPPPPLPDTSEPLAVAIAQHHRGAGTPLVELLPIDKDFIAVSDEVRSLGRANI